MDNPDRLVVTLRERWTSSVSALNESIYYGDISPFLLIAARGLKQIPRDFELNPSQLFRLSCDQPSQSSKTRVGFAWT